MAIKEVKIEASIGGQVQVKKYDIQANYVFTYGEIHDVEGLTQDEADELRRERFDALYEEVEPRAQKEFEALWEQRLDTGE